MMTKKDYIKIAELLKIDKFERDSNGNQLPRHKIRTHVIALFINMLLEDNPAFSPYKFVEYIENDTVSS